jgi:peptide/nickel transport system substrate-binding protein
MGGELNDPRVREGSRYLAERRNLSRRDVLALMGSSSLGLFLAGCGAGSGGGSPAARGGTGTAVLAYSAEPLHIDPHQASLAGESTIVTNLYDSLFGYEGFPPKRQNRLAEDFKVSEDGTTYDFKIKSGVKFHDGTPLTAEDVRYSLERVLTMQGAPSSVWQGILEPDMVSAPNDTTLRIKMPRPYVALPDTLAWLYVVNKKLVSQNVDGDDFAAAWLDLNDAGSGAFALTDYQKGTRLTFERYADYWRGWGDSYLDGWIFNVIREAATTRLGLQNGTVHVADLWTLAIDDLLAVSERGGDVKMDAFPSMTVVSIKQNNQRGPTSNKAFRKAVAYAFDYEAIVDGLLRGQTDRQYGAYPKGYKYFKDFKDTDLAYNTNLDQARHWLAESGVDVKSIGKLGYLFRGDDPTQRNYGLVLKSSLAEIGIDVELQGVSIAELLKRLENPRDTPNFTRISNSSLVVDPDLYCRQYLHSKEWEGGKGKWYTATYYKNAEVDKLIGQAQFEPDEAKREQMYGRIQDIVYDDAADVWSDQTRWLLDQRSNLHGYVYHGLGAVPVSFWPMYFDPPERA